MSHLYFHFKIFGRKTFFWDFQTLWTTAVAHRNDVPWYHNTKKKEKIGWRMEIGGKIDKM